MSEMSAAPPSDGEDWGRFSPLLLSLGERAPQLGVPFLQAFRVHYGPPGLLGRFFLSAVTRLQERGIALKFISSADLVALHAENRDNWGFFNPMFDARVAEIPPGTMILAGVDATGDIKAVICGKPYDATQRPFDDIVNAGGLVGFKRGSNTLPLETKFTAPLPEDLRGLIGYCAAVWVLPSARGLRLASIFTHLMSACMSTLWNVDCIFGLVPRATMGTGLQERYGPARYAAPMTVALGPARVVDYDALVIPGDRIDEMLATYLDTLWPQIDAAIATRDRQKSA